MKVFRIAQEKYIEDLTGIGAKITGGRWNFKGYPVLYCASNSSLAILEILVHTDIDLLPEINLHLAELDFPNNSLKNISENELSKSWKNNPPPEKLKRIGKNWVDKGDFLSLQVPSAVNPLENNFIINCNHTNFKEVKILNTFPLFLNDRLKK